MPKERWGAKLPVLTRISRSTFRSVLAWLVIGIGLSGCVTSIKTADSTDNSDDWSSQRVIVERSKARQPKWTTLAKGELVERESDLVLVTMRTRQANLQLGISQCELAAVDGINVLLGNMIATQIKKGDSKHVMSALTEQKLSRLAFESANFGGKTQRVRDIYYEGIDDRSALEGEPLSHYYTVYVLTAYAKDELPAIYAELAARLAKSPDPELKILAVRAAELLPHAL